MRWQDGAMTTDDLCVAIGAMTAAHADERVLLDPRHPSTHAGALLHIRHIKRTIASASMHIGFMHRSAEKLLEVRDYRQGLSLANRHDWLSAFNGELALALCVEGALGMPVPDHVSYTRMVMSELARITAGLSFLFTHPVNEAMLQLREELLELHERATGARVHSMFVRIGGVAAALSDQWCAHLLHTLNRPELGAALDRLAEYWASRRGIGGVSRSQAAQCGATGPVARGSGLGIDARVDSPYCRYDQVRIPQVSDDGAGDAPARMTALMEDMRGAIAIIEQCVEALSRLRDEPIQVRLPKVIKVPEGSYYQQVASTGGTAGVLLVSTGEKAPWRLKLRTPSFANAQVLQCAATGATIDELADVVASCLLVFGDSDR